MKVYRFEDVIIYMYIKLIRAGVINFIKYFLVTSWLWFIIKLHIFYRNLLGFRMRKWLVDLGQLTIGSLVFMN